MPENIALCLFIMVALQWAILIWVLILILRMTGEISLISACAQKVFCDADELARRLIEMDKAGGAS